MEPITAAANAVSGVHDLYGLAAIVAVLACALIALWIIRSEKKSKEMIAEIEKKERANTENEAAQTEIRKMARDAQIEELKNQFVRIGEMREKRMDDMVHRAETIERTVDRHLSDHKERDAKVQNSIDELARSLHQIELNMIKRAEFEEMRNNLRDLERMTTRIHAVIEARFAPKEKEGER